LRVSDIFCTIKQVVILYYTITKPTLSIPNHKELAPGLLRGLIRKSGISVKEFLEAG